MLHVLHITLEHMTPRSFHKNCHAEGVKSSLWATINQYLVYKSVDNSLNLRAIFPSFG